MLHAIELGIDRLEQEVGALGLKGKRVGLITNQTGLNRFGESSISVISKMSAFKLVSLFSPEHGLSGVAAAGEKVNDSKKGGLPVYSLHGEHRKPSKQMLEGIDVLLYDIQDVGIRSYTFASTLYYAMEAAAEKGIDVIVLDRPNPMGGMVVNGPLLEAKWRSFIGYVNVPYCHGMTIGELATFFNEEYSIKCKLTVVKMKGWHRSMSFKATLLPWMPTSPNVPEADTPYFQGATGMLGELGIVNIGIGYTLPFKVIGAPWIEKEKFAEHLNKQQLKGVFFLPHAYKPLSGLYKDEVCEGVLLQVTDPNEFMPVDVQFLILGVLKSLYPNKVSTLLKAVSKEKKELFCKAVGNAHVFKMLEEENPIAWKLIEMSRKEAASFLEKRKKYLFPDYS